MTETYHYRVAGKNYAICGAPAHGHDYAIYGGYFLGLARENDPGEEVSIIGIPKILCADCYAHEDVILALLGDL